MASESGVRNAYIVAERWPGWPRRWRLPGGADARLHAASGAPTALRRAERAAAPCACAAPLACRTICPRRCANTALISGDARKTSRARAAASTRAWRVARAAGRHATSMPRRCWPTAALGAKLGWPGADEQVAERRGGPARAAHSPTRTPARRLGRRDAPRSRWPTGSTPCWTRAARSPRPCRRRRSTPKPAPPPAPAARRALPGACRSTRATARPRFAPLARRRSPADSTQRWSQPRAAGRPGRGRRRGAAADDERRRGATPASARRLCVPILRARPRRRLPLRRARARPQACSAPTRNGWPISSPRSPAPPWKTPKASPQLQQLNETLEQRVAERTAAAEVAGPGTGRVRTSELERVASELRQTEEQLRVAKEAAETRQPGQEPVPGHDEPRNPHAHERHPRHDRTGAAHRR